MRISWRELPAAKTAETYFPGLLSAMEAEDAGRMAEALARYDTLPDEARCALGYMNCLLEAAMEDRYFAFYSACDRLLQTRGKGAFPDLRAPVEAFGWAGEGSNLGPAYRIDRACLNGPDSRIFYTDDDISACQDWAEDLAHRIALCSSGISDVRTEPLRGLRTMSGAVSEEQWCVTFRLDDTSWREVFVDGKPVAGEEGIAYCLLPKTGEFTCFLGEIVHGDPDSAFLLARDELDMK